MDELILTFTKEQYKKYNEIKNSENVILDFNTELPELNEISSYSFVEFISAVEIEIKKLLAFKKYDSVFSVFLTQDEIKEFIPVYYDVIREINRYSKIVGADTWVLTMDISRAHRISTEMCERYAAFLPYKAALYNREEYSSQIADTDAKFKESIEYLDVYQNELGERLKKADAFYNVIQEFYKKAAEASDQPKFKKFDAYDFFWATEAFLEQLKAIK